MIRAIAACILASALFQAVPAHTAEYYVATTGSNSNPGTEDKPWQTVAYAVDTMDPGDTTYVRGGTYLEATMRFKRSGTQAAPIKLLSYPGESPIIQCIDATLIHRMIIQHVSGERYPMGWITIEGFEIRNCYDSLKIHNGHDLTIRRNWIHDSLNQGIVGSGTRILIDRNRINHNGNTTGNQKHGIYMNGTEITITNNLIYDNQFFGIQANGTAKYDSAKHPGPEFALSRNWIIANNTIAYNRNRAAIVVWGSSLTNLRIENNIFYENGVTLAPVNVNGIEFIQMGSTGVQIRNNLSYASGSGAMAFLGIGATEGKNYTLSGNIVNTGDPRFVNAPATLPGSPNFALTERSLAIDKGLTNTATRIAFDGSARPQGRAYDIGAYEYNPHGDAQPPHAPIALRTE